MKALFRNIVRDLALDFLGQWATPSKGVHLMNGHLLTRGCELDATFFDSQLKSLSHKSTIIPFCEAVELIVRRKTVNHSLIAFSFDDGFEECYSHLAPVLEKYNGYGCFFINPNFAEGDESYINFFLQDKVHLPSCKKPMRWEQIVELCKRGHMIGAHTMDHVRVSEIRDESELIYQIGACKKEIETRTGDACDYFAFTYGHPERDFNLQSVEIAERYYKYIFSASNWKNYFSYNERVLNRRHFEPYWNVSHVNYFLSKQIKF